ncbi:MAG: hydrogenase iron-sulfur subunit [Proteobacteria bacterium]|nr:hydrogenase iron-sulfur subunit [Pseudomonadota bacterium]
MGECHYRSGNYEAINKIAFIRMILKSLEINADRIAIEWASAAEGPLFVKLITEFTGKIKAIGTLGISEGLKREELMLKIKAASMAVEGMKVRMAFAKQAKQIKKDKAYGHLPSEEKLLTVLMNEMDRKFL